MKRLLLVLVAAFVLLPGAAEGAACSPLNCAASQFTLGDGTLLGYRTAIGKPVRVVDLLTGEQRWTLPAGFVGGRLLVHRTADSVVWYDATLGTQVGTASVPDAAFYLVGASQDGTSAVLSSGTATRTTFLVLSTSAKSSVTLAGKQWQFDALRGDKLFLIRFVKTGGYQVRLVHLASGRLEPKALKDPHESGLIWGSPFARLSSADGRYLFTLYIGPNGGSMIHELDLQTAKARCIDLPGTGDYGSATSYALTLAPHGRLWAVSPGYGRAVVIDIVSRKVVSTFKLSLPYWNLGGGTSVALAPGGSQLALADGESVAVVDLATHKVLSRSHGRALALGYSPSGKLWTLT
jgi:hypothetical protein